MTATADRTFSNDRGEGTPSYQTCAVTLLLSQIFDIQSTVDRPNGLTWQSVPKQHHSRLACQLDFEDLARRRLGAVLTELARPGAELHQHDGG